VFVDEHRQYDPAAIVALVCQKYQAASLYIVLINFANRMETKVKANANFICFTNQLFRAMIVLSAKRPESRPDGSGDVRFRRGRLFFDCRS
jgi:hypothetical protein